MVVRFKPGVILEPTAVTARLLGALDRVAMNSPYDVTVTSGSDSHPPQDVHTLGRALDVRSHDMDDGEKAEMMRAILAELSDEVPDALNITGMWLALATDEWFTQLEHHGEVTEHIHLQRRKNAVPMD